jgi:hypothetical protein
MERQDTFRTVMILLIGFAAEAFQKIANVLVSTSTSSGFINHDQRSIVYPGFKPLTDV